ncbi:hypothetical protein O0L34_g19062 [Tuta absoluta]|nr:hypothetical protein O0L34_g19062 [Tuta absoluta]
MVRAYKRKTNRGGWDENRMRQAIKDVLEGKRGYKLASKFYEVPQTTLERKVKLARENENQIQNVKVPLGPIATVFTKDEEQELVVYLKEMEARLFGLTTTELQKLAYQLAVRNNKQHKFNNEDEMAGKVWLKGFLKAARAAGFNRVSVAQFFELLAQAYDKHGFTPDRIYNCDETGISVVPKTRSKVIAATGKKQVGALTSAERGTTITVEICFNAAGTYMPPMFIYPRKRMKKELLYGAPPNAWAECSDSGWITTEIFFMWFQKFLKFSNASTDNPVMLLLDGHASHTQNVQLIDEARKHGVTIICFPPHTTHKLQPGDVGFMRPLSVFYDQAVTAWLRSNPGHVVTQFQVAKLFGEAFIRSATMATAINAFKACGISPYNPQIFTDADFVAAEATDIELNVEEQPDAPNHTTEAIQQEPLMAQNSAITNSELPLHQNEANQRIAGASQTIEGALMLPCSSVTYNSRELNTEKQPPSASKSTESLPQQPISIQNAGTQSAPSASLPNKASQSTLSPSKPSTILQPTAEAASNSTVTPPIETSAKEGQLQSETPAPIAVSPSLSSLREPSSASQLDTDVVMTNAQIETVQQESTYNSHSTHSVLVLPPTATPESAGCVSLQASSNLISSQPSTSRQSDLNESAFHLVSPKQLMSYPRMTQKRKRQVRRRGKTAIITDSPYKTELEERQKSKKPKAQPKKLKKTNKKTKKPAKTIVESESESDSHDTECLYCQGLYSESNEGWITCQACGKWAHCGCAGVEDNDDEAVHICPNCEDSD